MSFFTITAGSYNIVSVNISLSAVFSNPNNSMYAILLLSDD